MDVFARVRGGEQLCLRGWGGGGANSLSLAVGQLGELVIVALGVHQQRPVHEVQVDIVQAQQLQGLLQAHGHTGVVSRPVSLNG